MLSPNGPGLSSMYSAPYMLDTLFILLFSFSHLCSINTSNSKDGKKRRENSQSTYASLSPWQQDRTKLMK